MAFNFMQSLIDNPNQQTLDPDDDNSDESDIDLDFEPLNQDFEELVGSNDDTDSVDLESGNSPSDCNWVSTPTPVEVDEFTEYTGVKCDLPTNAEPKDCFDLFFPASLLDLITEQINKYAEKQIAPRPDSKWKPVCRDDIQRCIYILIMFGIHKMGSYRHYWSSHPLLNVQQVSSVMGRERFEKITQYFHLNDVEQGDRTTEGFDPMLKIRPVLDHVRSACMNVYAPSCQLSIDEGMIGFKGRIYFRQYLPSKPE